MYAVLCPAIATGAHRAGMPWTSSHRQLLCCRACAWSIDAPASTPARAPIVRPAPIAITSGQSQAQMAGQHGAIGVAVAEPAEPLPLPPPPVEEAGPSPIDRQRRGALYIRVLAAVGIGLTVLFLWQVLAKL